MSDNDNDNDGADGDGEVFEVALEGALAARLRALAQQWAMSPEQALAGIVVNKLAGYAEGIE